MTKKPIFAILVFQMAKISIFETLDSQSHLNELFQYFGHLRLQNVKNRDFGHLKPQKGKNGFFGHLNELFRYLAKNHSYADIKIFLK